MSASLGSRRRSNTTAMAAVAAAVILAVAAAAAAVVAVVAAVVAVVVVVVSAAEAAAAAAGATELLGAEMGTSSASRYAQLMASNVSSVRASPCRVSTGVHPLSHTRTSSHARARAQGIAHTNSL